MNLDWSPSNRTRLILLAVLCALMVFSVLLLFLATRANQGQFVVIEDAVVPQHTYLGQTIDTLTTPDVAAVEGHRYRVRISGTSRRSAAGVARIGGIVTFIPGTQPGQTAIVEITRLKRSTAEAKLLQLL